MRDGAPGSCEMGLRAGIGEQGIEMFCDPRFGALGLEHGRLVVPYDAAAVKALDPSLWPGAHNTCLDAQR
jgi:hypothetical protein